MKPEGVFVVELEKGIRQEARAGWDTVRSRWGKPLTERISAGRALGRLRVSSVEIVDGVRLVHFEESADDAALFREGELIRISRNDPEEGIEGSFHGLTSKGLTVAIRKNADFDGGDGWVIDEGHLDLSEFYLKALDELATTEHGRDEVLPVLMGEDEGRVDLEAYNEAYDELEGSELDEAQVDAVANSMASERFHLVQGPPGTGKTFALARLVEELVEQGLRVLVSAFTHRAIHHALRKVSERVECPVFKVSDPMPHDGRGIEFRRDFQETELVDHPGPYVLGVTPISLFTGRAQDARFDVAVIDETSQLRVEAAMMPMLRAKRWFFFGDHQQLPPVVQQRVESPEEYSVFARLRSSQNSTMLRTTYRMNEDLVRWPSEMFYGGGLNSHGSVARHRFVTKCETNMPDQLAPEPSLVRMEVEHEGCRARSDEEAEVVVELVKAMLEGGIEGEEIGVVVPFRAQAARVRQLLRGGRFKELPDASEVVVDTVERFQGQEREAMIVGFVVSDFLFMERLRDFLLYPQRLNVAVTRARTKVVLVYSKALREWVEKGAERMDETCFVARSLLLGEGIE